MLNIKVIKIYFYLAYTSFLRGSDQPCATFFKEQKQAYSSQLKDKPSPPGRQLFIFI
jgi:hypothetical protein